LRGTKPLQQIEEFLIVACNEPVQRRLIT